jgi:hypothetical protein
LDYGRVSQTIIDLFPPFRAAFPVRISAALDSRTLFTEDTGLWLWSLSFVALARSYIRVQLFWGAGRRIWNKWLSPDIRTSIPNIVSKLENSAAHYIGFGHLLMERESVLRTSYLG